MYAAWAWVLRPPWRYAPIGLPLAVIAVYLSAGLLPRPVAGMLTLVAMLGLWALLFALASRLLLLRAAGVRLAREAAAVDLPPGVAIRHVLLWLLASVLLALVHGGAGLGGGLMASVLLALILPAATMALTTGQSFTDALYPPDWFRYARELGLADYLSLSAWLAVYALVYLLLAGLLGDSPTWLRNALQMAWWSAALLAWFAQAGLTLHAHRVQAPRTAQKAPAPPASEPRALFEHVMRYGGDAEQHRKLSRALEAAGLDDRALAHGQVHVPALLLTFERPVEALEQADRLLAIDPGFSLDDPTLMRRLIDAGRELAPPGLVVRLCRSYLARFTASLFTDEIRLTACEALAEDGSLDTDEGRSWLEALAVADLDPDQAARLDRLREQLEQAPGERPAGRPSQE